MQDMVQDIVVVGGGLLGAAIARDASLRGLSVTLFEKEDFAAGASSRLCRLAPGRLNALQTLDFTQVREDLRERETLLQIAPHLAAPQPCLVPFYGHGLLAQTRIRASLALADALSLDTSLPLHQLLSPQEALGREPGLCADGLAGAALLWEVVVPSVERLTLAMALDARDHGARLLTHTHVERLRWATGGGGRTRATGVSWTDRLTGETGTTEASLVIVAAGAWLPTVDSHLADSVHGPDIKSVSVIGPALRDGQTVLALPQDEEGRLLFVVPWLGQTWIGSLELPFGDDLVGDDLDTAHATGDEVRSLAEAAREFLPGLDWHDLTLAQVAVCAARPPAHFPLPTPASQIVDYAGGPAAREGLLSADGGSLTSCRSLAEEVVDLACRKLGRSLATPPCRTASTPLPGARRDNQSAASLMTEAALRPRVERAVSEEECRTLRDFLMRRTALFWAEDRGRSAIPTVMETMASLLGWDQERQEQERKAYVAEIALTQAFRVM